MSTMAIRNIETLEQRWSLVKGQRYVVSLSVAGYIAVYAGFGIFRMDDGREGYPMPAHVRDITPHIP